MEKFKLLLDFYIFFSVIALLVSGLVFFLTRKYNKDRIKILGFFLDLSKSQCILLATNMVHVIISLYCIVKVENFNIMYVAMLATNCIMALLCSLSLHYGIAVLIYDAITVVVLILLSLVKTYLIEVSFDQYVNVLSIVFSIAIIVYLMYATTRKIELLFKKA